MSEKQPYNEGGALKFILENEFGPLIEVVPEDFYAIVAKVTLGANGTFNLTDMRLDLVPNGVAYTSPGKGDDAVVAIVYDTSPEDFSPPDLFSDFVF